MITTILLTLIAVLLLARMILQVWQGKETLKRAYATTRNVRKITVLAKTAEELNDKLCDEGWWRDYELVTIIKDKGLFYAFLQSKEIKKYMEI